jgi:hypothetical protein
MKNLSRTACLTMLSVGLLLWEARPCQAFIEVPYTLSKICSDSTNIVVMKVQRVDKEKNLIWYKKVRDLKGKHPTEEIKHNIGKNKLVSDREYKATMDWAEVGKTAIFFHNGGASETCIGDYWYQSFVFGEWWNQVHGEPYLLRSFCGNTEQLAAAVAEIQAGKEVVVPCMIDGNKDDLHKGTAGMHRLRTSLKLLDYDPKRDIVGLLEKESEPAPKKVPD